jgi:hypothetical protein
LHDLEPHVEKSDDTEGDAVESDRRDVHRREKPGDDGVADGRQSWPSRRFGHIEDGNAAVSTVTPISACVVIAREGIARARGLGNGRFNR